jgi:hypothetical protein
MKYIILGIISRKSKNVKQYLLVSSVLNYGKYTNFYYPPGGQLKKGENEKLFLTNKIKDELGIVVTPEKRLARSAADVKGALIHWWSCNADTSKLKMNPKRLSNYKWFSREKLLNYKHVWPATKKFFEQYTSD